MLCSKKSSLCELVYLCTWFVKFSCLFLFSLKQLNMQKFTYTQPVSIFLLTNSSLCFLLWIYNSNIYMHKFTNLVLVNFCFSYLTHKPSDKPYLLFIIFKLYSIKESILVYLCTYLLFILFKLYSMKENILVYLCTFDIYFLSFSNYIQ